MKPAFYVARQTRSGSNRLMIESVPFKDKTAAEDWRGFIQSEHPKDDVVVIEVHPIA